MAIRELQHRLAYRRRVGRAGRVVRIDRHNRASVRCHQRREVIEIGNPAAFGIGVVILRPRAELGDDRRVQRVGRHRHEHFTVFVEQCRQREFDRFGCSRGDEDAIRRNRPALARLFLRDGLTRRQDAGGWSVAVMPVAERSLDGDDQMFGWLKAEGARVTHIEITHLPAGGFDTLSLDHDVANRVREAADAGRDRKGRVGCTHRRDFIGKRCAHGCSRFIDTEAVVPYSGPTRRLSCRPQIQELVCRTAQLEPIHKAIFDLIRSWCNEISQAFTNTYEIMV